MGRELALRVAVVEVGTLFRRPQRRELTEWILTDAPDAQKPFRFHFGQADTSDASHFTIRFGHHHSAGTIDGYLTEDGTVNLSLRELSPPLRLEKLIMSGCDLTEQRRAKDDAPSPNSK